MPDIQDQFGNKVKVACAACIRGHRSSQCNEKHYDRIMVAVRKPGRPLTACPHAKGQPCTCSSAQVTYTIPRATAKCASGAIQAIAVSANEPLTANPHAPSTARLKRMHQQRASKAEPLTPISKAEETSKDYFESSRSSESPLAQTPKPTSVSCCGRKPIEDEDESPSPTSPSIPPGDGMIDHQSLRSLETRAPSSQVFQSDSSNQIHSAPSVRSTGRKNASSRQQSHLLHDPANNGVDANGFQHGCNCGPGCACLGCAAHPQNSTTIQYVKELYDYQANEADDNTDSFTVSSPQSTSAFGFDQQLASYQNDPDVLPADLYFPYQLNLPGCETGGCRCGANCTCSGCLTHSGHNGISSSIQNPLHLDPFNIDNPQFSQVGMPKTSSDTWNGFVAPVMSPQRNFNDQAMSFQPPMVAQQNFGSNTNRFSTPGNREIPPFYSPNLMQMNQARQPTSLAFEGARQPQPLLRTSTFPITPVSHGHPVDHNGLAAQRPNRSPMGIPTTTAPFQQGYGF
ncbi:MAG: hypothetical protein M1822_000313 [Bathelium mastoideum]|nr:MAG: hypothetical protein M1822_000313 [Bathelium mastoideum]